MAHGEKWEPLQPWLDHALYKVVNAKANSLVKTHALNIVHGDRRWAKTVWERTGRTAWTIEEARAFLRGPMRWSTPIVMLSIFEAYEGGRCVHDCRFCAGAPFKEHGLGNMSADILNPRSSLPMWGHATAWRCKNYNTGKGGKCLDELTLGMFLDSNLDSNLDSKPAPLVAEQTLF